MLGPVSDGFGISHHSSKIEHVMSTKITSPLRTVLFSTCPILADRASELGG